MHCILRLFWSENAKAGRFAYQGIFFFFLSLSGEAPFFQFCCIFAANHRKNAILTHSVKWRIHYFTCGIMYQVQWELSLLWRFRMRTGTEYCYGFNTNSGPLRSDNTVNYWPPLRSGMQITPSPVKPVLQRQTPSVQSAFGEHFAHLSTRSKRDFHYQRKTKTTKFTWNI